MAKRRLVKSERGVSLTEEILFGGEPRTRVGTRYTVSSERRPEGRTFDTVDEAAKYFHVQVSFSGPKSLRRSLRAAPVGPGVGRAPEGA